ncbi:MAG: hypothetical protein P4K94_02630 [Terracidiphilus sp.]|nr:hypothetical protein [Terracidiphilus sp.]
MMRGLRRIAFALMAFVAFCCVHGQAQAALLMEEPYGFFGVVNPTGHTAIYLERVCAETPVKLRRCNAGEMGVVLSRYHGIDKYDWVAIPLIPYLYSVENLADVPDHVDGDTVARLRSHYREAHLQSLGQNLPPGNLIRAGWTQLLGEAYDRRIYAFRFNTTQEQDDALIARMNAGPNRSHFNLLFNNCADYARVVLNTYFPRTFRRSIFPDAGITTPIQTTDKLVRYARKHPEAELTIFEISQIPGYRRQSPSTKDIAGSLTTTGYAVPLVLMNPYLAGGLFADYLARGRFHSVPRHPQVLDPDNLSALTVAARTAQNPGSAGVQAPSAATGGSEDIRTPGLANSGLGEIKAFHE